MAGRVDGKVAFITGAARGQGRSHALRLAQEGADIIAVDICGSPVEQPVDSTGDARRPRRDRRAGQGPGSTRLSPRRSTSATSTRWQSAVAGGVEQLGRLDIVVANAGIGTSGDTLDQMDETRWQDMIDVNLSGVWKSVKAGVPHLTRRRPGRFDHVDQLGGRAQGLSSRRPLRIRQTRRGRADAHLRRRTRSAFHPGQLGSSHPRQFAHADARGHLSHVSARPGSARTRRHRPDLPDVPRAPCSVGAVRQTSATRCSSWPPTNLAISPESHYRSMRVAA